MAVRAFSRDLSEADRYLLINKLTSYSSKEKRLFDVRWVVWQITICKMYNTKVVVYIALYKNKIKKVW